MTTRWARFARGWAAAGFATFVAAFSHTLAGGGHPPLFAIALALAFSGIACVWLAGRSLSRLRLIVSVAISQLLYHGIFALVGQDSAAVSAATPAQGHNHATMIFSPLPSALSSGLAEGSVPPPFDAPMIAAHGLAGVLTVAAILFGDRLLTVIAGCATLGLGWLRRLAVLRRMSLRHRPDVATSILARVSRVQAPRDLSVLLGGLRHRGPPLGLSLA